VLLVWAPLTSLSLVGQEHGRTIPLPVIRSSAELDSPVDVNKRSVHQHSAGLDRTGPPFDFGWNEIGEICGAALIR
jgi:hypothetical protein